MTLLKRISTLAVLTTASTLLLSNAHAADPTSILHGSVDAGGSGSSGLAVAFDHQRPETWTTSASAARYDSDTEAGSTQSTSGAVQVRRALGRFGVTAGVDYVSDTALRKSWRWTGGADATVGAFRLALEASTRGTDYATVPYTTPLTGPNGNTVNVSGKLDCTQRDLGFALSVNWSAEVWGVYASGASNDFASLECGFESAASPTRVRLALAQRYSQLAGALADRLEARVGGRIGLDSALLGSQWGAGVWRNFDKVDVTLDFVESKSLTVTQAHQQNASLTLAFPVGDYWYVDVTGGASFVGSTTQGFAGVGVSVSL